MERTNSIPQISTSDFISSAVAKYVESNFSFSLWRLPNSTVIHLAASEHPSLHLEINLEEVNSGFLFAPFDPLNFCSQNHPSKVISISFPPSSITLCKLNSSSCFIKSIDSWYSKIKCFMIS